MTALLAKVIVSPTPSVTGGCLPATPTLAVTTYPCPTPGHTTPTCHHLSVSHTRPRYPNLSPLIRVPHQATLPQPVTTYPCPTPGHATPTCHHLSVSHTRPCYPNLSPLIRVPHQATLPQPSPVDDNSIPTRQPTDAPSWTRPSMLSTMTSHHLLNSNTPLRSQPVKKISCKLLKPTKGSYIIRKQTINPYSLTKKINTLAPAVGKISNVVCALQQHVCTLSTENLTLKTVIRGLKNQSISSSKSTLEYPSVHRFPLPANFLPPGRPKK